MFIISIVSVQHDLISIPYIFQGEIELIGIFFGIELTGKKESQST